MGNVATAANFYYWDTLAAWVKTEVDSETIKGHACCKDETTKEKADTTAICTKAKVAWASTNSKHSQLKLVNNDFFQSALAQCPHNTTNCPAVAKESGGTTAITIAE